MKKQIFYIAFAAIVSGGIFTSCESKQEKVEEAKEDVRDAKEELHDAQAEINPEYSTFRTDAEARIDANEKRIDDLQAVVNQPGKKPLDEARKQRIEELKERNAQLRARLYGYEKERSDWESFKREFNSDMDGLGQSFKDLGEDNRK